MCPRLRYIRDLIVVILPPIVKKILYSPGFSACCDLTSDILTPKSNQHIYERKYICDQNWVKFPSLVFETCKVFTRFSGRTDSRTHSPTHGRTDLKTVSLRHSFSTVAGEARLNYTFELQRYCYCSSSFSPSSHLSICPPASVSPVNRTMAKSFLDETTVNTQRTSSN